MRIVAFSWVNIERGGVGHGSQTVTVVEQYKCIAKTIWATQARSHARTHARARALSTRASKHYEEFVP